MHSCSPSVQSQLSFAPRNVWMLSQEQVEMLTATHAAICNVWPETPVVYQATKITKEAPMAPSSRMQGCSKLQQQPGLQAERNKTFHTSAQGQQTALLARVASLCSKGQRGQAVHACAGVSGHHASVHLVPPCMTNQGCFICPSRSVRARS